MVNAQEAQIDLSEMRRPELMSHCKSLTIPVKPTDTKKHLLKKINDHFTQKLTETPTPPYSDPFDDESDEQETTVTSGPSTIIANPEIVEKEVNALGINIVREPKTTDHYSASEVVDECNHLFAGRAQAKYDPDNPLCIEFHGGPRQRNDVTIAQSKKSILMYAATFCSRAFTDARNIGRKGDSENAGNLDLDSLTPAQMKKLGAQLKEVMAE